MGALYVSELCVWHRQRRGASCRYAQGGVLGGTWFPYHRADAPVRNAAHPPSSSGKATCRSPTFIILTTSSSLRITPIRTPLRMYALPFQTCVETVSYDSDTRTTPPPTPQAIASSSSAADADGCTAWARGLSTTGRKAAREGAGKRLHGKRAREGGGHRLRHKP